MNINSERIKLFPHLPKEKILYSLELQKKLSQNAPDAPTNCQALDSRSRQLCNCYVTWGSSATAAATSTLPSLPFLDFMQPWFISTAKPTYFSRGVGLFKYAFCNSRRLESHGIVKGVGSCICPLILFLEHQHCYICLFCVSINWKFSQMGITAAQEERNTISHGQLIIFFCFLNSNIRTLLLHLAYVNS